MRLFVNTLLALVGLGSVLLLPQSSHGIDQNNIYQNTELNYKLGLPENITYKGISSTSKGPYFSSEQNQMRLYHHISLPCTPPAVGNLDATEIEGVGEKTLWANMPLYHPTTVFDDALCIAPNDPACTKVENYNRTCESDMGVYAFCSQQGDKTVAICITQQQDDPELAKQIFESFRWTSPPPPAQPSTPLKFGAILGTVILVGAGVFMRWK